MSTLKERYAAAKASATAIHDAAKADDRTFTDDERAAFDAALAEASELRAQIDAADADAERLAALVDVAPAATPAPAANIRVTERPSGSWGETFINSAAYRDMTARYAGQIPASERVQMERVVVGGVNAALITDPGFAPIQRDFIGGQSFADDMFTAIDLVDLGGERVIETYTATLTNAADDVAEGVLKPESSVAWTSTTVNLGTVAHWVPVTNQALASSPIVRNEIDVNLVSGVRAKLASNVATAVAGAAGVQAQAFDTDIRTTIRRAITKAQTAAATLGTGPISVLVSAADAETLDLEQLTNLVLAPGQSPAQASGIWRSPLVVSPTLPAGFAYVGDLKQVKLYTGGPVSVTTGWQGTQFVENKLTILAEVRAAPHVRQPSALVKADLTAL